MIPGEKFLTILNEYTENIQEFSTGKQLFDWESNFESLLEKYKRLLNRS